NLAIDAVRSRKRRDEKFVEEPRELDTALESQGKPTFTTNPGEMSERAELKRVLHEAMSALSEKHRAVIVLREVEGLSYEEIAEVLGIAKGTVMSRLFHARKNLQSLLTPYVESGEPVLGDLRLAPGTA
ncbi:MAG: sigma-70 family RNA polymerase sigma factor, partial [Myxococcota bacterium]